MNTQSLLGLVAEQTLTVVAAKQQREPVEVSTQLNEVIRTASHETAQRLANPHLMGNPERKGIDI
jgi:hypothetical protein